MSVLLAIQDFIKEYSELKKKAPVWVNFMGPDPTEYSIVPLAGPLITEEYINGKTEREYPFALQSMESTITELARIANQEFYEEFAAWLRTMSNEGTFPDMDDGQTPYKIMALGHGVLLQKSESETGVYQIQCRLEYSQIN